MYRWTIFCCLSVYLLLSSRPVLATVIPQLYLAAAPSTSAGTTAFPSGAGHNLRTLVQGAELIVQGRVWAIRSEWNHDHTLIESEATITVARTWLGGTTPTIQVRTTGGYLPDAQLGLISMHEATFAMGEEVLLFARPAGRSWRVVGGAMGKFQVEADRLINHDLALTQGRADFFTQLGNVIAAKQPTTGASFQQRVAHLRPSQSVRAGSMPALTGQNIVQKWATPHATAHFYVNLNTAQVDTAAGDRTAFRTAITNAAQSWSAVTSADFDLSYGGASNATETGYNGVNEVLFMHKGATERAAAAQVWYKADGTIMEADIWINDDYRWNATGQPAADEVDLQSALLHEFGHWLILGHTGEIDSVMFPRLATGTVKHTLQAEDQAGISAIYPR